MSFWWVVGAFVLGGYAGMLVLALMSMAAREDEQAVKAKEAVERDGLGLANLETHLV